MDDRDVSLQDLKTTIQAKDKFTVKIENKVNWSPSGKVIRNELQRRFSKLLFQIYPRVLKILKRTEQVETYWQDFILTDDARNLGFLQQVMISSKPVSVDVYP